MLRTCFLKWGPLVPKTNIVFSSESCIIVQWSKMFCHLFQKFALWWWPDHQMAQRLNVSPHFLSRITGTVYMIGSRTEAIPTKNHIGLNIKFGRKNEEVGHWFVVGVGVGCEINIFVLTAKFAVKNIKHLNSSMLVTGEKGCVFF